MQIKGMFKPLPTIIEPDNVECKNNHDIVGLALNKMNYCRIFLPLFFVSCHKFHIFDYDFENIY